MLRKVKVTDSARGPLALTKFEYSSQIPQTLSPLKCVYIYTYILTCSLLNELLSVHCSIAKYVAFHCLMPNVNLAVKFMDSNIRSRPEGYPTLS